MFTRIYAFFALFCFVYFLESIGGTYMVSAIQSIERQFEIGSKLSGLLVSASDFGYLPTVVVISYIGSKGNRARWIGAGTFLIAASNYIISSPNFFFPVAQSKLNSSQIVAEKYTPSNELLGANVTIEQVVDMMRLKF